MNQTRTFCIAATGVAATFLAVPRGEDRRLLDALKPDMGVSVEADGGMLKVIVWDGVRMPCKVVEVGDDYFAYDDAIGSITRVPVTAIQQIRHLKAR